MSNGGIIGPVNDPIVSVASSPGTATFNSSGTYTSGPQAKLVDYLVVAGGVVEVRKILILEQVVVEEQVATELLFLVEHFLFQQQHHIQLQ
jgi:hypothetical protein